MPGPRRKFRERPKKTGARKRQRVKEQRRRLISWGMSEEEVKALRTAEEVKAVHSKMRRKVPKKPKSAARKTKKKTKKK